MDKSKANSKAWDWEADHGSAWAEIISERDIEAARSGKPGIRVTVTKNVPLSWVAPLKGKRVLCLGGGGGQQTPMLAAYGCEVTVVDISERMLGRDSEALSRFDLQATLIKSDMETIELQPSSFDGVISPVSLNFAENLPGVYRKVYDALTPGGIFIFGIANPALYMLDDRLLAKGKMKIRYTLPFSDTSSLSEKELEKRVSRNDTVEYSHTLDMIIGDLTKTGFSVTGFFSDISDFEPIDSFLHDCYLAIRCEKR